jgi:D-glycero-D-manno-heptose 1,7-bisphosphate phosphatase
LGVDRGEMTRAVFVDRDGVINDLVPDGTTGLRESPLDPERVELLPEVASALRLLRSHGFALVGVSNQPAAAKGTVNLRVLHEVQARVIDLLAHDGATLDAFKICFHHPDGSDPDLGRPCDCRKPAPGMLLEAALELDIDLPDSWMVGDTDGDIEAGSAAGCRTVLVETPGSAHKRSGVVPTGRATSLMEAANLIVDRDTK